MFPYLRAGAGRTRLRGYLKTQAIERKLRLFIVACCRRLEPLISDARSRGAIELAEQFADDAIDEATLAASHQQAAAAYAALRATSDVAAYCAACPPVEATRAFTRGGDGFHSCVYAADTAAMAPAFEGVDGKSLPCFDAATTAREKQWQANVIRDLFGNPFRPVAFDPSWNAADVVKLAGEIEQQRRYEHLPQLAKRLQHVGCECEEILDHCRRESPHARGCWLLDGTLGR